MDGFEKRIDDVIDPKPDECYSSKCFLFFNWGLKWKTIKDIRYINKNYYKYFIIYNI